MNNFRNFLNLKFDKEIWNILFLLFRLFMYYHTLANQTKPNRDVIAVNKISYETHR